MYTRPQGSGPGGATGEATLHARGTLTAEEPALADAGWSVQWPPEGADPLAVDALYTRLADIGYALLEVADAIRDQSECLINVGVVVK